MGGQISINTQGKLHKQRLPLNELTLEINSRNMDRTQDALFTSTILLSCIKHRFHVSREPRCYFGPSLATVVYPRVTYLLPLHCPNVPPSSMEISFTAAGFGEGERQKSGIFVFVSDCEAQENLLYFPRVPMDGKPKKCGSLNDTTTSPA